MNKNKPIGIVCRAKSAKTQAEKKAVFEEAKQYDKISPKTLRKVSRLTRPRKVAKK